MSSGKKGKKAKGKTLSLNDFLADGKSGGSGTATVVIPTSSWADQVDEDDGPVIREQFVLPTAPRAARGSGIDESRIPRGPPYTAFIANLSFETNVDEITRFFGKLNVKSVRLVREGNSETGRLKGIGYVDFEDRQSLVEAIGMDGLVLQNRSIMIDLADGTSSGDRERGGDRYGSSRRYGGGGGGGGEDDRTAGDWRSGPSSSSFSSKDDDYNRPSRGGGTGYDRYESRDNRYDRDDRRDGRGYGFREDRYSSDRRSGFDRRDGRGGGGFDRRSPEPPRERPKLNLQKRSDKPSADGSDAQEVSASSSAIFGGAKPVDTAKREAEIEKRTVKDGGPSPAGPGRRDEDADDPESSSAATAGGDEDEDHQAVAETKKASIFGSAKPVDTAARLREIEERLANKKQPSTKADSEEGQGNEGTTSSRDSKHEDDDDGDGARDNDNDEAKEAKKSSIFGLGKPVDTSAKEREIEERLSKRAAAAAPLQSSSGRFAEREDKGSEPDREQPDQQTAKKPSSRDIFGLGKPVDTAAKEREIEERLRKQELRSPTREESGREKRGVRPGDHDDNHYSRENNHGSSDKVRSYGRQEQEGQGRGGDGRGRHDGGNQGHRQQPPSRKHDGHHSARSDRSPPPMKKMDEAKPPNFVGSNKFSGLLDDEDVGSGGESD